MGSDFNSSKQSKPQSETDYYYLAEGHYKTENGYNIYWILSNQKAEQDKQTRTRQINEAFDALKSLQTRLNKYNYSLYV